MGFNCVYRRKNNGNINIGNRGKETKRICDKNNWTVQAFIDNNISKLGSLEETPVIAPDDILQISSGDIQVWIATGADEVHEQAKKLFLK